MISLNCKNCGETNQVESFLAAAQQNCLQCGRPLMGESLSGPTTTRRGEPKPWERLDQAPVQVGAGTRDISIKAVASVNFFFGTLYVLCGLLFWVGSSMVTNRSLAQGGHGNVDADKIKMAMNIVATVIVLLGMPMILAGVGLLTRAAWGRSLALVLAGLSALLCVFTVGVALLNQSRPDVCGLVMYLSYSGITFFVLLQPEVAAEFGSKPPSEPS